MTALLGTRSWNLMKNGRPTIAKFAQSASAMSRKLEAATQWFAAETIMVAVKWVAAATLSIMQLRQRTRPTSSDASCLPHRRGRVCVAVMFSILPAIALFARSRAWLAYASAAFTAETLKSAALVTSPTKIATRMTMSLKFVTRLKNG